MTGFRQEFAPAAAAVTWLSSYPRRSCGGLFAEGGMSGVGTHIVKAFNEDLASLRGDVAAIGGLAEAAAWDAAEAVIKGDPDRAARCREAIALLLRSAAAAEKSALCVLALRAPVAGDLRQIMAILKIVALLERTAAQSLSIVAAIPQVTRPLPCPRGFGNLARLARDGMRCAIDAFVTGDASAAETLAALANDSERLHLALLEECVAEMRLDRGAAASAVAVLLISRSFARIAEHSAAIAAEVCAAAAGTALAPTALPPLSFPEQTNAA
ncbi:hypothetical protein E2493_02305 [Sphingomonas parva]|uniref:PhoU domain-containing protein n=1 Tax=Sphingomonas parva TaxID=2555898 RepID=A0A4Y8ZYN2_9SPHN|nr:PhoU domain-containing protein [Sphingomonas parva]TFI60099.1 hypothetical protein E2493_02305 [Sphingomonas parva]